MDVNTAYDEMTAAWRDARYAEAWDHADAILLWLASGGFQPDAPRDVFYVRMIHENYAPAGN